MSYRSVEVLGRVERRRRFSVEQKLAVLAEVSAPDANMSAVARRHGLLPSQVFKWRRLAELGVIGIPGASELPSFVAVEVGGEVKDRSETVAALPPPSVDEPRASYPVQDTKRRGVIEIDLGDGRRVRVDRDVDAEALGRVLAVLGRR